MQVYKITFYYNLGDNKSYYKIIPSNNKKTALITVKKMFKKSIVVDTIKDITLNFVVKRDMVYLCLISFKFIRHLALIFLAVDVTFRYHLNGFDRLNELIAIFITVFGLYGFLSWCIDYTEKEFKKIKNYEK